MWFWIALCGLPLLALFVFVGQPSEVGASGRRGVIVERIDSLSRWPISATAGVGIGLVVLGTWGAGYVSDQEAAHCGQQHMSGGGYTACIMSGALALAFACGMAAVRARRRRAFAIAFGAGAVLALPLGLGYLLVTVLAAAFACG